MEALEQVIKGILTNKKIEIVSSEVGSISDSDLKLAQDLEAYMIGFKVSITKSAKEFLIHNQVQVISSEIIYDLIKKIEDVLKEKIIKLLGRLEILAYYGEKGRGRQIIGGKASDGSLKNNLIVDIERNGKIIDQGKIINLQKNKKDSPVLNAGETGGMIFECKTKIEVGDILLRKE